MLLVIPLFQCPCTSGRDSRSARSPPPPLRPPRRPRPKGGPSTIDKIGAHPPHRGQSLRDAVQAASGVEGCTGKVGRKK